MTTAADLPPTPELINPPALYAKAQVKLSERGNVRLSNEPGYKKVITFCADVNGVAYLSPAENAIAYLGYKFNQKTSKFEPQLNFDQDVRYTILQQPKYGVMINVEQYQTSQRIEGGVPIIGIVDRVVYLIEVKEYKFKVIVNLLNVADGERIRGDQACEYKRFSSFDAPDLVAPEESPSPA